MAVYFRHEKYTAKHRIKLDGWQLLSVVIVTLATRQATVYLFTDTVCATSTHGFVYILHN